MQIYVSGMAKPLFFKKRSDPALLPMLSEALHCVRRQMIFFFIVPVSAFSAKSGHITAGAVPMLLNHTLFRKIKGVGCCKITIPPLASVCFIFYIININYSKCKPQDLIVFRNPHALVAFSTPAIFVQNIPFDMNRR